MSKQEIGPNQDKWLAALRSGDYRQNTVGMLNNNGAFCCLGVAAEIFKDELTSVDRVGNETCYDGASVLAPGYVVHALGLYDDRGMANNRYDAESYERALTVINDDGTPFAEIADIVEADPSMYFREPR